MEELSKLLPLTTVMMRPDSASSKASCLFSMCVVGKLSLQSECELYPIGTCVPMLSPSYRQALGKTQLEEVDLGGRP